MIIDEMRKIVEEFKKINPNFDDLVDEYLKKEIELFNKSLKDTIFFLDNADEDSIVWTCTVWDSVSEHFKSKELIMHMEKCVYKYPSNKKILEINLEYAKKALNK